MRRTAAALALVCAAGCAAADGGPAPLVAAWLESPTDIYGHRVLGDIPEAFVLAARGADGAEYRLDLRDMPGDAAVFEDVGPRVVDADGDGAPDIVVVEADLAQGAQLAVYGLRRGQLAKTAATPHIGTRHRWLAPVAVADLDGDGVIDLAYVDRPHLARTLRVWSWAAGGLTEVASLAGVTNHRIGEPFISGGLRDCGAGPEMVLATADWRGLVAVQFADGALASRDLGPLDGAGAFAAALACTR